MSRNKSKNLTGAKSIFVANVKGGVGKSTLSIMLARSLAERIPAQNITVIDTIFKEQRLNFYLQATLKLTLNFFQSPLHLKIQISPLFNNLLSKMNSDQDMLLLLTHQRVVLRGYGT